MKDTRESSIEQSAKSWAKENGVLCLKQKQRGIPDDLFLTPEGFCFVEFKTKMGKLSALQQYTIHTLRMNGFTVFVPYSVDEALISLSNFFNKPI